MKKMAKTLCLKITELVSDSPVAQPLTQKICKAYLAVGKKDRYKCKISHYHGGYNSLFSAIIKKISPEERLYSFNRFCKTGATGQINTDYTIANSTFYTKTILLCGGAGSS